MLRAGQFLKTPEDHKNAGNQFAGQGQYDQALACYQTALTAALAQTPPDNALLAIIHCNMGIVYKIRNDFRAAILAFEQVIQLSPAYIKAHWNLAHCQEHEKQYAAAWQTWHRYGLLQGCNAKEADYGKWRCENKAGVQCVFGVADLIITPAGEIKILEFGDGASSDTTGWSQLPGVEDNEQMGDLATKAFEELLPRAAVCVHCPNTGDQLTTENVEYMDCLWKDINTTTPDSAIPAKIPTEVRILTNAYGITRKPREALGIHLLNGTRMREMLSDKNTMHRAFVDAKQTQYRPLTSVFPANYSDTLTNDILHAMSGKTHIVIKIPNVANGVGVTVTETDPAKLDLILRCLLLPKASLAWKRAMEDMKPYFTKEEDYTVFHQRMIKCRQTPTQHFLVEEWVCAKPVTHKGQTYLPTTRVAFVAVRDGSGNMSVTPLLHFRKFPPVPGDALPADFSELRRTVVSSFAEHRVSSGHAAQDDKDRINAALTAFLPSVIDAALRRDPIDELKTKIEASPDDSALVYEMAALAERFFATNEPNLLQYMLDLMQKHYPDHFMTALIASTAAEVDADNVTGKLSAAENLIVKLREQNPESVPPNIRERCYLRVIRACLESDKRDEADQYSDEAITAGAVSEKTLAQLYAMHDLPREETIAVPACRPM